MAPVAPSRRQEVVKHSEKQARLDQFIGFYLDRLLADWADRDDCHVVTAVARSAESPVARALVVNAPDLLAAGVRMTLAFAEFDASTATSDVADLALISSETEDTPAVTLFRLANPALIDAHEQLVLGTEMSWCGDAMRRNPLQRDTVEVYDPCCPATAAQSTRAFRALMARANTIPMRTGRSSTGAANMAQSGPDARAGNAGPATLSGAANATRDGALILTRH